MALNITDADAYVSLNVIDTEEWEGSDETKKQRILNVASRTLTNRFKQYTVPDNAVYEFAAYLANVYSDTNKMQQYGIKQFSISGIAFTFDGSLTKELDALIPNVVYELIGEHNGVKLSKRRIGRSVR